MYTSANKIKKDKSALKTMLVYSAVSAFCIFFNKVYALYGHGVTSASMSLMFLYPLIGGAAVFMFLWLFKPDATGIPKYRLLYNLYNSGIAALVIGSMLKGIFEIAGTSSQYTVFYFILGWMFIAVGIIGFLSDSQKQKNC